MEYCRECIWGNGINEDDLPVPFGYPKGTCKTCGAARGETSARERRQTPPTDSSDRFSGTRRDSMSSRASTRRATPSHAPAGPSVPVLPYQTSESSQRVLPSRRGSVLSQALTRPPTEFNYPASDHSSFAGSQVSYLSGHQYPFHGAAASSVTSGQSQSMLSMLSTRQTHVGGYKLSSAGSISGMAEPRERGKDHRGSAQQAPSRVSSTDDGEIRKMTLRVHDTSQPESQAQNSANSRHRRPASMSGSSMAGLANQGPMHILHVRSLNGLGERLSHQEPHYRETFHGLAPTNASHQAQHWSRESSTSSSSTPTIGRQSLASQGEQTAIRGSHDGRRPSVSITHPGFKSMHSAGPSTAQTPSAELKHDRRRSINSMHSAANSVRSGTLLSRTNSTYGGTQRTGGEESGLHRGVAPSQYAQSTKNARRFSYNAPAQAYPPASPGAGAGRRAPTPSRQNRNGYISAPPSVADTRATESNCRCHSQTVENGLRTTSARSTPRSTVPTQSYGSAAPSIPPQQQYTHLTDHHAHAQPAPPAQSITADSVLSHIASQQTGSAEIGGDLAAGMSTMSVKTADGTEVKIVGRSKGGKGRRMSLVIED